MKKVLKRVFSVMVLVCFCFSLIQVELAELARAESVTPCEALRVKWVESLNGGASADPNGDPVIANIIGKIDERAENYWNSMADPNGSPYLWADCNSNTPNNLTESYGRLKDMTLAYTTYGSALEGNQALRNDIIQALDWMYVNWYNYNTPFTDDWWFAAQIGAPRRLVDITAMLFHDLSDIQKSNYMNVVNYFCPDPTKRKNDKNIIYEEKGANRVWKAYVVALRGTVTGEADKIAMARDALSQVFPYVTSGDGFYTDGTFIQHSRHPYNGGYGAYLLDTITEMMYLLDGSPWEITDPNGKNVFQWIYNAYEPLIYKGAFMAMFRGREIAREGAPDSAAGRAVMRAIIRIASMDPNDPNNVIRTKSIAKRLLQSDVDPNGSVNFIIKSSSINEVQMAREILSDIVNAAPDLNLYKQYTNADRAVSVKPGYTFGVSMSSNRIYNYESISNENLKGWYTGDGMTYLYNNDLTQYSDHFWPTVNPYRLPGTTVDTRQREPASIPNGQEYRSNSNWAGGVGLLDRYGIAGMWLDAEGSELEAKKSWFMLDDQIVCVGSDINRNNIAGNTIETVVENRKLNTAGNNIFIVNGNQQLPNVGGAPVSFQGSNQWMHLDGNAPGAAIGYFFPGTQTVQGLREERQGKWKDINLDQSSTLRSKKYLALWFDHGTNPNNGTYQYVLLPGKTPEQTRTYAQSPESVVIANTENVHAIYNKALGIVGANFWSDGNNTVCIEGNTPYLNSDKQASVMVKSDEEELDVAVSDPTQVNSGSIRITLNENAGSVISKDSSISVLSLSPVILSIQVKDAKGKGHNIKLSKKGTCFEAEQLIASTSGDAVTIQNDSQASGGKFHLLQADTVGDFLAYTANIPKPGKYRLLVRGKKGPDRGKYQVSVNGAVYGVPIDQYENGHGYEDACIGSIYVEKPGDKTITLSVAGKNTQSSGYKIAVDSICLLDTSPQKYEAERLPVRSSANDSVSNKNDANCSGGQFSYLEPNAVGDFAEYTVNVAEPGIYDLMLASKYAYNRAIFQVIVDGKNVGMPVDQYSAATDYRTVPVGLVSFDTSGEKTVRLQVTGRNSNNTSGYGIAVDTFLLDKIHASQFQAEALAYTASVGDTVTCKADANCSGGAFSYLDANAVNDFVEYTMNVPAPGVYTLYTGDKKSSNRGRYQLLVEEAVLGPEIDQYGSTSTYQYIPHGQVSFTTAGSKKIKFKVVNSSGSGYGIGIDDIWLIN